jgi:hypothetical protein
MTFVRPAGDLGGFGIEDVNGACLISAVKGEIIELG